MTIEQTHGQQLLRDLASLAHENFEALSPQEAARIRAKIQRSQIQAHKAVRATAPRTARRGPFARLRRLASAL